MYSPPYNRIEDRAELLAFLRANSFAVLVTRELRASHLPVQVRATESELILDMHMARANPQWQDFFDDEALVVFSRSEERRVGKECRCRGCDRVWGRSRAG